MSILGDKITDVENIINRAWFKNIEGNMNT